MVTEITMIKKHSPHEIVFSPDPGDDHFTDVKIVKVKTGVVVRSHYILSADVAQWIEMYEGDGYLQTTMKNNKYGI